MTNEIRITLWAIALYSIMFIVTELTINAKI